MYVLFLLCSDRETSLTIQRLTVIQVSKSVVVKMIG
jgi:hypothetical protein